MKNFRIFDAHTHVYPAQIAARAVSALGRFYDFVPQGNGTVDELIRDGSNASRDGFLLLAVATNAQQVRRVNEYAAQAARIAKDAGKTAFFFAGMHQDCPDMQEELCRAIADGARGMKLHPDIQGADINDRRFYPAYEVLEEKDLPLCLHMGDDRAAYRFSEPRKLEELLRDFPHLRVQASHFGGYRALTEASEILYPHENVYYDTSSALWYLAPESANKLADQIPRGHLMFGSDYPVERLDRELRYFERLSLTDGQKEEIMYRNAAAFLGF